VDFPNSHQIYLSDDQALDYYSLLQIYRDTNSAEASLLAQGINVTMVQYGGLFHYWNPVFEILGDYGPFGNSTSNGNNVTYGTNGTYTIKYTNFSANPNFNYSRYSDALAYRVLMDLHYKNYCLAETDFAALNATWNGYGFVDKATAGGLYQSYKLADYLIAWNQLLNASALSHRR